MRDVLKIVMTGLMDVTLKRDMPPDVLIMLGFLTQEKASIPSDFCLPLENKLISFTPERIRCGSNEQTEEFLLLTAYVVIKVIVKKIFFKPLQSL